MAEMQNSPGDCVKCGVNYQGHARHQEQVRLQNEQAKAQQAALSPVVREVSAAYQGAQPVVVVDIRMSFWSMVIFMVKWVIASIPAAIILAAILGFMYGVVTAVPAFFAFRDSAAPSTSAPTPKAGADSAVQTDLNYNAPSNNEVLVPDGSGDGYFNFGISYAGEQAIMTVYKIPITGNSFYSKMYTNCHLALAAVTPPVASLNELIRLRVPEDYSAIRVGTPRYYLARRACRDAPVLKHTLLE